MIYCLSLNPSLDKSASVARFSFDAPNRIGVERLDVSGKSVNVAKVAAEMGGAPCLIGFDYAGDPIRAALEAAHIPCRLVPVQGELRTNLKLRETERGRTIEISERGAAVSPAQLAAVEALLLNACQPGDWAVLSGSLPPGAGPETYARLCAALKQKGCLVAADCDGPAMEYAFQAGPDLVKPNAQEFQAFTQTDPGDLPAVLRACQALHRRGVPRVCLSRGPEGALLSAGGEAWLSPAAPVPARGVQGAGDSLLAGLILALSRGETPPEALRYASAVAGASVMRPGTLLGKREDAAALLLKIPPARRCS